MELHGGQLCERIRVLVAPDMIVMRPKGVLPAAEQQLIHTEEGRALVKQLNVALFAQQRHILVNEVAILTGMEVADVRTDFALLHR